MRISVLCGGDSPERDVSLDSGREVAEGLKAKGHSVELVDLPSPEALFSFLAGDRPDLCFVALHGGWGEDGRLQAVLDMAGVPYTGSGPSGCAVAMDKTLSKGAFAAAGLDVPWGVAVHPGEGSSPVEALSRWGTLVVKPCCGGSTVATYIVSEEDDLRKALSSAWKLENRALVEAYVAGRELTVTVVEDRGIPRAFPIVEILPDGEFYDYRAKYGGGSRYVSPADLEPSVVDVVSRSAEIAHRVSGCSIYSRVDIRLDGKNRPFVLEVNTVPGMTSNSLVPKAARAGGFSFPDLLDHIVEESMASFSS